jgi:hypothetical protein
MMVTFIICLGIYLLIGIMLVAWAVMTDPYGGFILHFAVFLVLFYPYFIIRSLIESRRR